MKRLKTNLVTNNDIEMREVVRGILNCCLVIMCVLGISATTIFAPNPSYRIGNDVLCCPGG